jgi:hypothetical protein
VHAGFAVRGSARPTSRAGRSSLFSHRIGGAGRRVIDSGRFVSFELRASSAAMALLGIRQSALDSMLSRRKPRSWATPGGFFFVLSG